MRRTRATVTERRTLEGAQKGLRREGLARDPSREAVPIHAIHSSSKHPRLPIISSLPRPVPIATPSSAASGLHRRRSPSLSALPFLSFIILGFVRQQLLTFCASILQLRPHCTAATSPAPSTGSSRLPFPDPSRPSQNRFSQSVTRHSSPIIQHLTQSLQLASLCWPRKEQSQPSRLSTPSTTS